MPSRSHTSGPVSAIVALKKLVEETSPYTGQTFFDCLVKNIAEVLCVHGVWVTEYLPATHRLRAISFWLDNDYVEEYEYDVEGTPCELVVENPNLCHIPEKVVDLYPRDPDLKPLGAVSYMGLSLRDGDRVLGHLAILDNKPMKELPETFAIFRMFADRAAAELRRVHYEREILRGRERLKGLFDGAWEAIVELDQEFRVSRMNSRAEKCFEKRAEELKGQALSALFKGESLKKLENALINLQYGRPDHSSVMLPGRVDCGSDSQTCFPGEVSLSRYGAEGEDLHYALFIRNIKDHLEQQATIEYLQFETSQLRERIRSHQFDEIIGESPGIRIAIEALEQVAATEATVLILGETGTGKELFARALHRASLRSGRPYITLNCAALPADLIESELFGHEKGAFTGAVDARKGRFALADGGTIFLDEIGEMPISLQAKLLRVLQEGTFEPVGSSKSIKVDVRVVAATHRDLPGEIEAGRFREDLYYRLNVFPIHITPLRERGDDILLIAHAFIENFARRNGIGQPELDEKSSQAMLQYDWPGNVRELQNIIERALILSKDGQLDVRSLLASPRRSDKATRNVPVETTDILNEKQWLELEKNNILRALEKADWKVSGKDGAASVLGIPATTLNSRIKKLGIKKQYS